MSVHGMNYPRQGKLQMKKESRFNEGQTVWIRDLESILRTLDADGKLEGLPFMPEMIPYCGQSFRISCVPEKTCVEGVGLRGLSDIVFLDNLRCDASAHDGCQRGCLLFWKQAWLSEEPSMQATNTTTNHALTSKATLKTKLDDRYFCQSTELAGATIDYQEEQPGPIKRLWLNFRKLQKGEMSLAEFVTVILNAVLVRLKHLVGIDTSNAVLGALQKTESSSLDLQPGDWVEVKSRKEIEKTLDTAGKNKGLLFDPPMLNYCGKRYRVAVRLQKMILEETGKMIELRNTVVLEDVVCHAWGCPRANFHFWREIWLKRV
jgi:hypothetical protein